ncbi:MAG: hypothetical protein AMXMBFR75_18990 [Candidatus Hinthialibacteria bacterium]
MLVAGMMLAALTFPVHQVMGENYTAPYYSAPGPEIQQAMYGGAGCAGGQGMGYGPGCMTACDPCADEGSPATKLGRGVTNVLTGWLEFPKHTLTGVFNCNVTPLEGLGVGMARGMGRAIERTGVGIFEVVTFPIPGFSPLLCPEYISLESNCMAWRNDCYCGGNCPPPCPSFNACPPPCPPPCPPAPCGPPAGGMSGWNQALQKPANTMAMGNPPSPMVPTGPARDRAPGAVTYPDDFLK